MGNLFSVFEIGVGVYLLYGAITGKGQMFQTENIKKDKIEAYKKLVRIMCFIIGPMLAALGVVDYLNTANPSDVLRLVSIVLMVLSFIGVAVLFVIAFRMTDRTKKAAQGKPKAPTAAFQFDEEDKQKPGEK